jgi:hypothetical protein
MNSARSVTVTFTLNSPTQSTLAVTKSGTGTGSINSSPQGIDCGIVCSALYDPGTVVTLTAMPDTGSAFTGWSGGGCSGTGTCTITINADTSVTATFTAATSCTYTISPTYKTIKANGGNLSVKVTGIGRNNCPAPTIGGHDDWLSQSGNISWKKNRGVVKVAIQKNTSSQSRTGEIWIGGNTVTIEESGIPCQFSALQPSYGKFTNESGTGSFDIVVSPQDCSWQVTTTSDWIHLDTLAVMGNGSAAFHIDANTTGKSRTGKIDVSPLSLNAKKKKTFSITQGSQAVAPR